MQKFTQKQIEFVINVMIAAAVDTVECSLPQSKDDQPHFDKKHVDTLVENVLHKLTWDLSIFYAQVTGDSMGCDEAGEIFYKLGLNDAINFLVNQRFNPKWKGIGKRFHNIPINKIAKGFAEVFEDKPDEECSYYALHM